MHTRTHRVPSVRWVIIIQQLCSSVKDWVSLKDEHNSLPLKQWTEHTEFYCLDPQLLTDMSSSAGISLMTFCLQCRLCSCWAAVCFSSKNTNGNGQHYITPAVSPNDSLYALIGIISCHEKAIKVPQMAGDCSHQYVIWAVDMTVWQGSADGTTAGRLMSDHCGVFRWS